MFLSYPFRTRRPGYIEKAEDLKAAGAEAPSLGSSQEDQLIEVMSFLGHLNVFFCFCVFFLPVLTIFSYDKFILMGVFLFLFVF